MENMADMLIETILEDSTNSFLIVTPGEPDNIVVGVPHHAPPGTSTLPIENHPEADENAGALGYYLSRLLNCPSIIACNYFIDSNKDEESDYCKKIISLHPKILVEIHGHGGRKANYDIEISSGSLERNCWSQAIARRLANKMSDKPSLQRYTLSGDFRAIYFKASGSLTINTDEWVAFHIELPKPIRQDKSQSTLFCKLLAETLGDLLDDFDNICGQLAGR